jgi:menaquinone-dependent protoporphyrinogen oxidase
VFYATREGHTRKIAEYLASELCGRGVDGVAVDINSPDASTVDWASVRGVLLGASIHIGKHEKEAVAYARQHRAQLNERPSAFFSVSLSAASANPDEVKAAEALANRFIEETGWYADHVVSLAGCLAYTRYGFVKRLMLRRIAKKEGASTDTSRDHEYTDWDKVRQLAAVVAARVKSPRSTTDAA